MTFYGLIQNDIDLVYFRSVTPVVLLLRLFSLDYIADYGKTSWCSLLCVIKSTTVHNRK